MAPLTRGRAGTSRVANHHVATYYGQRASAGLIISEATAISDQGYGWYGAPGLYTHEQAEGWKLSVDAVHAKGGRIFAQLWHMGRRAHSSFHASGYIEAPSPIAITAKSAGYIRDANQKESSYEVPHELTIPQIQRVIEDFQTSAKYAKQAGFDGVEIHGANGYLLDTFIQSKTNRRSDRYGGESMMNRARIVFEVIDAVSEIFSKERIGLRLSPNGTNGEMGSPDNDVMFPYIASQLALSPSLSSKGPLGYLHVMDGLGYGYHRQCRPVTLFEMKAKAGDGVCACIGNIEYSRDTAEGAIRSGAADLIAFGRPFISNPDLVERFANNWPLEGLPDREGWYGRTPNPEDSLKGYHDFPVYQGSK